MLCPVAISSSSRGCTTGCNARCLPHLTSMRLRFGLRVFVAHNRRLPLNSPVQLRWSGDHLVAAGLYSAALRAYSRYITVPEVSPVKGNLKVLFHVARNLCVLCPLLTQHVVQADDTQPQLDPATAILVPPTPLALLLDDAHVRAQAALCRSYLVFERYGCWRRWKGAPDTCVVCAATPRSGTETAFSRFRRS